MSDGAWIHADPQSGQDAIVAGGPADEAGLRDGDIIVSVDGETIDHDHQLDLLATRDVRRVANHHAAEPELDDVDAIVNPITTHQAGHPHRFATELAADVLLLVVRRRLEARLERGDELDLVPLEANAQLALPDQGAVLEDVLEHVGGK